MSEDFDDLYGSQYLAASDVKKPFVTTIETVDKMDFARQGEQSKMKAVLILKGVKKPVVCNKTNALNLSEARQGLRRLGRQAHHGQSRTHAVRRQARHGAAALSREESARQRNERLVA
jgi:hypothetical protein